MVFIVETRLLQKRDNVLQLVISLTQHNKRLYIFKVDLDGHLTSQFLSMRPSLKLISSFGVGVLQLTDTWRPVVVMWSQWERTTSSFITKLFLSVGEYRDCSRNDCQECVIWCLLWSQANGLSSGEHRTDQLWWIGWGQKGNQIAIFLFVWRLSSDASTML